MNFDLMDAAKGMVTPELVGKAAEATGESPDSTHKAIQGAVPAVLAGFAHSASKPGGAAQLFGTLTEGGASGTGLMNRVLGERSGAVSDALANSSGIKQSSASHILSLAFPMIGGLLGKQILSNHLNLSGFTQLLSGHKEAILDNPNTPPGLASALGLGKLSDLGGATAAGATTNIEGARVSSASAPSPERRRVVERAARAVEHPVAKVKQHSRSGLVIPVLLLSALAVWGIFAMTRSHEPRMGVMAPQPVMPSAPSVEAPPPAVETPGGVATPTMGPVALPGGKSLDVDPMGPEAAMALYLRETSAPLPHKFDFERLTFESGTATVTADSDKTIDALTMMLQAYPSARVRLEGHTDSIGDPFGNQQLSQTRATAVKATLVARGIAGERIETAGKSEHRPLAGNESQGGRALNRRVDVVLLSR
jgi:OmpA-OmpF porin, OOP family